MINHDEKTAENTIQFFAGEPRKEILRFSDEGFFYRGEKIEDVNKIYNRFTEWMNIVETERTAIAVQQERQRVLNRLMDIQFDHLKMSDDELGELVELINKEDD